MSTNKPNVHTRKRSALGFCAQDVHLLAIFDTNWGSSLLIVSLAALCLTLVVPVLVPQLPPSYPPLSKYDYFPSYRLGCSHRVPYTVFILTVGVLIYYFT